MTPQQMEHMLRQTLADRRLSGGERQALGQALTAEPPDAQQTAVFRHLAFELARQELTDPKSRDLINWLEDVVKLLHPIRQGAVSVVQEALFAPEDNLLARICQLFEAARSRVDVCVFTITDDRISEAILRAHRRGVPIRVVTDNDKSFDLGSDILRLEEAGVAVREDRTEAHMHHKFAIFDGALLLNGSYNWTRSAGSVNAENIVLSSERRLIDTFSRYFEAKWQRLGP